MPTAWNHFSMRRRYRNADYIFTVRRTNSGELPGWKVNGTPLKGSILPYQPGAGEVHVEGVVE
jgi:cellobiose phosphorylase